MGFAIWFYTLYENMKMPVQCCFLFMAVNGEGHRIAKSEDIIIQLDDYIWS